MKYRFTLAAVSVLLLLSIPISAQTVKVAMEPNHSTIGFAVNIAGGVTRVTGKFMDFSLEMDYVDNDITRSSVLFTIQVRSINTGIDQRDDHLRSEDFFDAEKYPEITFESSQIQKTGEGYEMTGMFAMHGVTREVTIPFQLTNDGGYPSARIRWSLNREDYGINYEHSSMKNFLAKEILVEIDFWTRKAKKQ